jgi:RNA polymerase sigma-70 factor (ECF subfamily)
MIIQGAAAGNEADRAEFARRYERVVRAYLAARWRDVDHRAELDDAVQEVFVECFRPGGVLDRADPAQAGGFRAFLCGVAQNVARRVEGRRAREQKRRPPSGFALDEVPDEEARLSQVFDRAWARMLVREAATLHERRAHDAGEGAVRRVELLRLRFHDGLKIREIARLWQADAAVLHHDYARARSEFKKVLFDVVASHWPGNPDEVEQRVSELLDVLGG